MNVAQDPLTFWHWAFALIAPAAVYCVLAALAWLGERETKR